MASFDEFGVFLEGEEEEEESSSPSIEEEEEIEQHTQEETVEKEENISETTGLYYCTYFSLEMVLFMNLLYNYSNS